MTDPIRPPVGGVDPETNMVTPPVPGPYAPQEPILTVGSLAALVAAILAAVVAFGVDLTEAQTKAVLGLALVLAPIVVAFVARRKAWAPATVRQTVQAEVAKAVREVRAEQPPASRPGEWLEQ